MMTSPRHPDANVVDVIEGAKIIALTVGAGCLYGVLHDLVTTRVSLIYFTEAHPPIFGGTHDPTLLALGWGVLATWWVGLFLGTLLCGSARLGSLPEMTARDLFLPIARLLIVMAVLAGVSGLLAGITNFDAESFVRRFNSVLVAHIVSYITGFFGGVILCIQTVRRRRIHPLSSSISAG